MSAGWKSNGVFGPSEFFELPQITTPSNAGAGFSRLYVKADGKIYTKTLGVESAIPTADSATFTSSVQIPDGTVSVPSLAFTSDADGSGTGIYRVGANSIGITNNGTQTVQLNSTALTVNHKLLVGPLGINEFGTVATSFIKEGAIGSGSQAVQDNVFQASLGANTGAGSIIGISSVVTRVNTNTDTNTGGWSAYRAAMKISSTYTNATTAGWAGYRVAPFLNGGTSIITHYAGFRVDDDTTNTGANKYGLYIGALSGATNNYGVFQSGTALNVFGGRLNIQDGTVSLPSIAFSTDPDTGIYLEGTTEFAFAQAGVRRFKINTSGNLEMSTATRILLADGTAPSPALNFASDPNTGLYSVSADRMMLVAGASDILQIDSTLGASVVGSQIFSISDGNATTPGFTFNSDRNTGIYRVGADQMGISIGGSQTVQFNPTFSFSFVQVQGPNGSVGTPSFSFNSDADTGFFRLAAGSIAFTSDGTQVASYAAGGLWTFGATGETSNHSFNGNVKLDTGAATDTTIFSSRSDSPIYLRGGSTFGSGGYIGVFPTSHATHANKIRFFSNAALSGEVDANGKWTLGASAGTQFHRINGALEVFGGPVTDYTFRVVRGTAGVTNGAVTLQMTDVTTDDTNKQAVLGIDHYDNANADVTVIGAESLAAATNVVIGGGFSSGLRAATTIGFYTEPSSTTGGGVLRGSINNNGLWTIGSSGGTQTHAMNGHIAVTGQIRAADGTEAVPSISFTNGTTNGFYSTGGASFGVSASGTAVSAFSTSLVSMRGSLSAPFVIKGAISDSQGLRLYYDGSSNATIVNHVGGTALNLGTNSAVYLSISTNGETTAHAAAGNSIILSKANDQPALKWLSTAGNSFTIENNLGTWNVKDNAGSTVLLGITQAGQVSAPAAFNGSLSLGNSRPTVGVGIANPSSADQIHFYTGSTDRGFVEQTGKWVLGSTGGVNQHNINGTVLQTFPTAGSSSALDIVHTDSGNAASHARLVLQSEQTGGGDAYVLYKVNGQTSWSEGIDNSDSDKWKVSNNGTLGTNDYLAITTGGTLTLGASAGSSTHRVNGSLELVAAVPSVTIQDTGTFGTDANPQLSWKDGTTTGVTLGYTNAAQSVFRFASSSNHGMFFNNNSLGDLGGATSTGEFVWGQTSSGNSKVTINRASTSTAQATNNTFMVRNSDTTVNNTSAVVFGNGVASVTAGIEAIHETHANPATGHLGFWTTNAGTNGYVLYLNKSNNVGVNTSSPNINGFTGNYLTIKGSSTTSANLELSPTTANTTANATTGSVKFNNNTNNIANIVCENAVGSASNSGLVRIQTMNAGVGPTTAVTIDQTQTTTFASDIITNSSVANANRIKTTQNPTSLADGGTKTYVFGTNATMLFLITNQTSGETALFLEAVSTSVLISQTGTQFQNTNGAGKIGVTISSGTVSVNNQLGSTQNIQVLALQTGP